MEFSLQEISDAKLPETSTLVGSSYMEVDTETMVNILNEWVTREFKRTGVRVVSFHSPGTGRFRILFERPKS